ncbi:MAG: class B sortase [Clostridia bacterium]|nr:class B sortase [Clostridia bacterium]
MKSKECCFVYSEINKYPLDIPAELDAKIERTGKKGRSGFKKNTPVSFMFFVRIAAVVVLAVAVGVFAWRLNQYSKDIQENDAQINSISISSYLVNSAEKRATPAYPEYEGKTVDTGRIDYPQITDSEKLTQYALAYPDFVCWLYIENTTINYPVVQAEDNDYYLRRNIDGESNISGTLFLDFRCDRTSFKGHNIIYGHNNQNGTMFGPLKKYTDKSFYDAHSVFYTYTKDSVIKWKIFSAYETDTDDYYIRTYFASDSQFEEFLKQIKNKSVYDTGVEVTAQDRILSLSTCYLYNKINGRFVVHAVKIGESPLR